MIIGGNLIEATLWFQIKDTAEKIITFGKHQISGRTTKLGLNIKVTKFWLFNSQKLELLQH